MRRFALGNDVSRSRARRSPSRGSRAPRRAWRESRRCVRGRARGASGRESWLRGRSPCSRRRACRRRALRRRGRGGSRAGGARRAPRARRRAPPIRRSRRRPSPRRVRPCASMIAFAPGLAEALPSMRTTVASTTLSPARRRASRTPTSSLELAAPIARQSTSIDTPAQPFLPSRVPSIRGLMQTVSIRIRARRRRLARVIAGLSACARTLCALDAVAQEARRELALPRFQGPTLVRRAGEHGPVPEAPRPDLRVRVHRPGRRSRRQAARRRARRGRGGQRRDPRRRSRSEPGRGAPLPEPSRIHVPGDLGPRRRDRAQAARAARDLVAPDRRRGGLRGRRHRGARRSVPKDEDDVFAGELRRLLYLEPKRTAATPLLGTRPAAPDFDVVGLDGKAHLTLDELAGKVVVLVFFLPTCPHCHDALKFLDGLQKQLDNPDLAIVSVSVSGSKYVVEDMVSDLGISLVPYIDPSKSARDGLRVQARRAGDLRDRPAAARGLAHRRLVAAHPRAADALDPAGARRGESDPAREGELQRRGVLRGLPRAAARDLVADEARLRVRDTGRARLGSRPGVSAVSHRRLRADRRLRSEAAPGAPARRAVRELSRPRRPASVAGVPEGGLRAGLPRLSHGGALAALRVRGAAAAGVARRERTAREPLARGAPEAAREARQARAAAVREGRVRRLRRVPELPREGARAVGRDLARARVRHARQERRPEEARLPALSHHRLRRADRLSRTRPRRSRTSAARAATGRARRTSTAQVRPPARSCASPRSATAA